MNNNIVFTSKRCLAQVRGTSKISLFAKTLLSYTNWNSPNRKLKWMSLPVSAEKLVIKQTDDTVAEEDKTIILKTENIKSNHSVFRLYPYLGKYDDDDLLPTPLASDGERSGQIVKGKKKRRPSGVVFSSSLQDLAKSGLLPTPTVTDSKGNVTKDRGYFNLTDIICKIYNPIDKEEVGGTNMLNPLYVEEMMGFPTYWTLEPFLYPKESENE